MLALINIENAERLAAAIRTAKRLQGWRGHFLAPATRKADRQITYEAVVKDILFAITESEEETDKIVASYFPA
ncbi:MAG TPA: hypothetical protein VJ521_01725 [Acidobacteriota bacterium]|nr:hypothetical protein [Acidobacteriota bacterium]